MGLYSKTTGEVKMENPLGLKVGDVLSDNDVRQEGQRRITISAIFYVRGKWYVRYNTGRRQMKVSFDRLYVDGLKHSQGYSLVRQ